MIDARVKFAKAMQAPDEAHVKKLTDHFAAQSDLFTQCRGCGEHLSGTLEQIVSHQCPISDLLGV